jgi:exopolysaccharide biosynthesis polyprenyl glycosylphosphotransferase
MRSLRTQRMMEFMALQVAPALAVGAILLGRLGLGGPVLVAVVATIAAGQLLGRSAYDAHLLSFARVVLRALAPVIGVAAGAGFELLDGGGLMPGALVAAVTASWLILAVGFSVERRFDDGCKVHVAVLSPGVANALADELRVAGIRSHDVVGWVAADGQAFGGEHLAGEMPCLGRLEDVRSLVLEHRVDLLVSCPVHGAERARLHTLEIVADSCLDLPVKLIELSQLYEDLFGHVPLGTTDAAWFQHLLDPGFRPGSERVKRAVDLVLGSLLLVLASPLIAVAGLAVKLTDGGPVLYRQRRVGQGRAEFTMLKLRSMAVDAEAQGARWAEHDDDRTTPVGRLMRRTHIDELPQLLNVLRGEMSLVGPRPERPALVPGLEAQFHYYKCRHVLKPGITGWGQVRCGYAGSDTGAAWKLCHDLFYLKHRSTISDLLILVETVRTVATGAQYGLRAPDENFLAETLQPVRET